MSTKKDTENEQRSLTRRRIVTAAGTTVLAPSFIGVASGATSSGFVELTTTATVPSSTTIDVTIYEDTNGDGTADNQQTMSIPDGTDQTTQYDALSGTESNTYTYWMDVQLSTSDTSVTPELDSATITLPTGDQTTQPPTQAPTAEPVEGPDNPQGLFDIWGNYRAFVALVILFFGGVGLWGKSMALAAYLGYIAFAYIAVTTGTVLFTNILYVTIVLIFVGFAFKLWRLEFGGE